MHVVPLRFPHDCPIPAPFPAPFPAPPCAHPPIHQLHTHFLPRNLPTPRAQPTHPPPHHPPRARWTTHGSGSGRRCTSSAAVPSSCSPTALSATCTSGWHSWEGRWMDLTIILQCRESFKPRTTITHNTNRNSTLPTVGHELGLRLLFFSPYAHSATPAPPPPPPTPPPPPSPLLAGALATFPPSPTPRRRLGGLW